MTITVEKTIAQCQERLNRALVDGDPEALEELVAPDCRIIGPKGFIIAKDEWVGVHASGVYEQVLLRTARSEVLQHGDAVIRCDVQQSECVYRGERISGLFRVQSVWVRAAGRWRLAATQYTALPADVPER
jgi:hypothetical protein